MPETPPPIPTPEDESSFDLEAWIETELYRQYDEQVEILKALKIVEHLADADEIGIVGIDGKEYPLPTKEMIAAEIRGNEEKYRTKIEQGFTQFLLVPFAMPLDKFTTILSDQIFEHGTRDNLYDVQGNIIILDNDKDPLYDTELAKEGDEDSSLTYYPQGFDKPEEKGKTKQEILDQNRGNPFNGWNILLIEDLSNLPGKRNGREVGGRQQIESDKRPHEYLELLRTDPRYQYEQGMTPEDWMAYALQRLEQNNQIIDLYDNNEYDSPCLLIGTLQFSPNDGVRFLEAYWNLEEEERKANIVTISGNNAYERVNIRSTVRIGSLN